MKSERKPFISALFLLVITLSGCSQDWKLVRQEAAWELYMDPSSVEKADHLVSVRVKQQRVDQTTYTVSTYQIQCANRTYRLIERLRYNMDGILASEDNDGRDMNSFITWTGYWLARITMDAI